MPRPVLESGEHDGELTSDSVQSVAPFRVLVVADVSVPTEKRLSSVTPMGPIRVDAEALDDAVAALSRGLLLQLPDPLDAEGWLEIEVPLEAKRSFHPATLCAEIHELSTLRAARHALLQGGTRGEVEQRLASACDRPDWRAKLLEAALSPSGEPTREGLARAAELAERACGELLLGVLEDPAMARLERVYRGVQMLVEQMGEGRAEVYVAALSPLSLADAINRAATKLGAGVDLIVADVRAGATARELSALRGAALAAEGLRAPLLVDVEAGALGFDDLSQLATSPRSPANSTDARAVAFRTLASDEASQWLVPCINRVLLRDAHSAASARLDGVSLSQGPEARLFVGAAFAVAASVVASVTKTGVACMPLTASREALSHLASWQPAGNEPRRVTEGAIGEGSARECARAGVTAVVPIEGGAALVACPTLFRGAQGGAGQAKQSLADQLFVAHISSFLEQQREASHGSSPQELCEQLKQGLQTLFEGVGPGPRPTCSVRVSPTMRALEVFVRPEGFQDVQVHEIGLSLPLR